MTNPNAEPGGERRVEAEMEPTGAARVRELMSAGKFKQAVEAAKDIHKRDASARSERLLVDAYLGRIEQFESKGATEDARTLIKLVSDRFPKHAGRLVGLESRAAAAQGDVQALVRPLARTEVDPQVRDTIESAIRRQLIDLPGLANCSALPADHPLRAAAGAVWRAFQAVTSGPVDEASVALPEVSRRSPLAGWKSLVRGIAAFYQEDDEACRRAIEQIPPDAAARRLALALLAIMDNGRLTPGAASVLAERVRPVTKDLQESLEAFERSLQGTWVEEVVRPMHAAVQACMEVKPEAAERLRQHIAVRCAMVDLPMTAVARGIGRSRKEAYYWRLLARGMEQAGSSALAALYWDRFRVHGAAEGMFAAGGPEAAAIHFHAASLLAMLDQFQLDRMRRDLRRLRPFDEMYQGQDPEIAALKPKNVDELMSTALSPAWHFRRSADVDPTPQVFSHWFAWASRVKVPERELREVAELWRRKLPRDVQAPLLLSDLAETRGALKQALTYLAEAEALDATSPMARKARLRLTLLTTWRHFKAGKSWLVEKDLAELEGLPAMNDGDRPALLLALRAACHALRPDPAAARQASDALVERAGPVLASALLISVQQTARLRSVSDYPAVVAPVLPDPHAVANAAARLSRIGSELPIDIFMPLFWPPIINDVLRETPTRLSQADLLAIGKLTSRGGNKEQAYLVSTAGLESATGPNAARFLLLRAWSLPDWAYGRRRQCLRAASDLARQANDTALLDEVAAANEDFREMQFGGDDRWRPLGEQLLADVLKREREARVRPKSAPEADRFVVAIESDRPREPFGDFGIPFPDDEDDEDDDDFDEDDEDDDDDDEDEDEDAGPVFGRFPSGIPENALPVLLKIIEKYGDGAPEEIVKRDPALALELFAAIQGLNLEPGMMEAMADLMKGAAPRGVPGKRKPRRKS